MDYGCIEVHDDDISVTVVTRSKIHLGTMAKMNE